MIIESSGISLSSSSSLFKRDETTESLRAWVGKGPATGGTGVEIRFNDPASNLAAGLQEGVAVRIEERVELTKEALALIANLPERLGRKEGEEESVEIDPVGSLYTYKLLIEAMTGRRIKVMDPNKTDSPDSPDSDEAEVKGTATGRTEEEEGVGWGIEYRYKEVYREQEVMLFKAGGVIRTAEGVERGFSVKLRMERSFYSETTFGFAAGDGELVDPLVINFTSGGTNLTAEKHLFDLNSDGIKDSISLPAAGSGLLVYDKNSDGVANNGGELFGPGTGNGFAELSAYDSDSNYWIDENDPVYNSLRVWIAGPNGEETLVGLQEVGIGAIYLKYTDTQFSIKDSANNSNGEIKRTSIYLNERYGGGTIQQVDLVV